MVAHVGTRIAIPARECFQIVVVMASSRMRQQCIRLPDSLGGLGQSSLALWERLTYHLVGLETVCVIFLVEIEVRPLPL